MAIPPTSIASSTSTPSSSTGDVTLEDIMVQLVRMGARLDTLSDELCQVNTRFSRIARQQVVMRSMMVMVVLLMLMRMTMLALLVLMRCLLDILTLCHS